jgi:response regulator RpfG family c-di-GMP phosphodiesterase
MTYTILAVDDEPANLRMLERLFRKDYRVLTAESGEDALAILNQEAVSLIITDQRMPGMSGTQLLSKSHSTHPEMIKIILTGYTDIDALTEAINTAQVYRFVSKPWDPITLKQIVEEAFRQYEMSVQQRRLLDNLVALVHAYPGIFGQLADNNGVSLEAADEEALRSILSGTAS